METYWNKKTKPETKRRIKLKNYKYKYDEISNNNQPRRLIKMSRGFNKNEPSITSFEGKLTKHIKLISFSDEQELLLT